MSGPGALSQRTDGGPGSDTQPLSEFPAEFHGQRKQLRALQQAAPLEGGGGRSTVSPPSSGQSGAAAAPVDAFGPSLRPGEPVTAGGLVGPGRTPLVDPADVDIALQAMYSRFPHPEILRLLQAGNL
ncbi:MAG: hypothetical protein R3324_01020 [Halobacteriales archaeon]|nr:hypothetical protein [Halobacteriales archaeon]